MSINDIKRVGIPVEKILLDSLDDYIEKGDGWDIEEEDKFGPTVDINRSALIRFLISAYGEKETFESGCIIDHLYQTQTDIVHITVNSSNTCIKNDTPKGRKHNLVHAMVYVGIPIRNFFDGRNLLV